jgi:hypothetical protein
MNLAYATKHDISFLAFVSNNLFMSEKLSNGQISAFLIPAMFSPKLFYG